jgi:hypothetical protein
MLAVYRSLRACSGDIPRLVSRLSQVAIVLLLAAACSSPAIPADDRMARDVEALAGVLPALERLRVIEWVHTDSCRNIDYEEGAFANNLESGTCPPFGRAVRPFNAEAEEVWSAVSDSLTATGVPVWAVDFVEYDSAGEISYAEFLIDAPLVNRWTYVYDTSGNMPAENHAPAGEMIHIRIDDNWYFRWEDWM